MYFGGGLTIESHQEKLLGISIDRDFGNHAKGLYKNAGRKLNAISTQCKILPFFYRGKTLLNTFFDSAFAC